MAIKIGVGTSKSNDPQVAAKEAVEKAFNQAGETQCDFVFLFSTVGYDQQALVKEVRSLTGNVPLAGCSGEGIVAQGEVNEKIYGAGVMVIKADDVKFTNFLAKGLKEGSQKAGEELGKAIKEAGIEDEKVLLLFPDGLTCNMKQVFEGIEGAVKLDIPFLGGTSGDNLKSQHAYQYFNEEVFSDAIVGVLVSGNINMQMGVSHGCVPLGMEREITKAEGNRIFEIDNQPAYQVLTEYLAPGESEDFSKAMAYFVIGELPNEETDDYERYLVRACMSRDEKDNSVTIPTEMPAGTKVQLMRRDPELLIEKARNAAEKLKEKVGGAKPKFVFHFDCAGRGKALFGVEEKVGQPINAMQEVIGKDVPWLGFFTFGEIGTSEDRHQLHNYTALVGLFY